MVVAYKIVEIKLTLVVQRAIEVVAASVIARGQLNKVTSPGVPRTRETRKRHLVFSTSG